MGIWLELIALALCAYAMGLGTGWLLWHRGAGDALRQDVDDNWAGG